MEKLKSHFAELPVVFINGKNYDLNVIRAPLISLMCKMDPMKFAVKRNHGMKYHYCLKYAQVNVLVLAYAKNGEFQAQYRTNM